MLFQFEPVRGDSVHIGINTMYIVQSIKSPLNICWIKNNYWANTTQIFVDLVVDLPSIMFGGY